MDTYRVAHTAKCKLHLQANRKDRNLRFLLGHALTLDNVTLRIMEIENQKASKAVADEISNEPKSAGRRISFVDNNARPSAIDKSAEARPSRAPSPPPESFSCTGTEEDLDGEYDDDYDDDEDEHEIGGASLQRFGSAAAQPPRLVDDDEDEDEDDDGPVSPPQLPSDFDFTAVTSQDPDEELTELYNSVSKCRCHGSSAPKAASAWPLPAGVDGGDRRLALVRVGS